MTEEDKKLFKSEKFPGTMYEVPFDRILTQVKLVGSMHAAMYYFDVIMPESLRDSEEWKRLCKLFDYIWESHGFTSEQKLFKQPPQQTNPDQK